MSNNRIPRQGVERQPGPQPTSVLPTPEVEPEIPPSIMDDVPVVEVVVPVVVEVAVPDPLTETRAAVAAGDQTVRALLVEREGLERYGKTDRVAHIDEQLQLRGYPMGK